MFLRLQQYYILSFYPLDWSEWSSWSLCSPTCYDGIQTRSRTCLNTTVNTTKEDISCNGTNREVLSCNEINCVGMYSTECMPLFLDKTWILSLLIV